jgi:hypothetical protein
VPVPRVRTGAVPPVVSPDRTADPMGKMLMPKKKKPATAPKQKVMGRGRWRGLGPRGAGGGEGGVLAGWATSSVWDGVDAARDTPDERLDGYQHAQCCFVQIGRRQGPQASARAGALERKERGSPDSVNRR